MIVFSVASAAGVTMKSLLLILIVSFGLVRGEPPVKFPKGFQFGVATAAYQIEGGWNVSGKGESIWDRATHTVPGFVIDGSHGDVACDSYNNYKRDVQMLVELGVDFYRFSISWPRLIPTGFINKVSQDGFKYYNDLIDELIKHNIEPVATLYHWDLPQGLQEIGGWTNPLVADHFEDYANLAFMLYGDRVKTWLTFNEPQVFCQQGYGGSTKAPMLNYSGVGDYMCGHTVLRAHAKAYHIYDKLYRSKQGGRIGMTLSGSYRVPSSDNTEDMEASERYHQFEIGWFAHPVFSQDGDYPQVMKEFVARKSSEQGFGKSRLPEFTQEEIESIKGTYDFFGLNHYTTYFASNYNETTEDPSYSNDIEAKLKSDPKWPSSASNWLKVVPWGFRKILNWIRESYDNVETIIYECGYSDHGKMNDTERIYYLKHYLANMLEAIDDGCNVTGFSAWSLMDNMEWQRGYTERFGLYYVDFNSTEKTRTPKESAKYYKKVIEARQWF